MKLNLAKRLTNAISHREQNTAKEENPNYDPLEEFENWVNKLFEKRSKLFNVDGNNYHVFTNPDSGKEYYLTDSQAAYIKQQIEANAMHNSFINSVGMGHLCHKTTSYFQDLDSIIESMERTPVTIVNGRWVKPEFKVDKGSFVEYVCEDGEVIIPEIQSEGGGIYQNFDNNLSRTLKLLVGSGTALAFAGCAMATKQTSLYDTNLLTKQYTPAEIKTIEQNFNANPLQYSQEFGNLLLWQMHQKSPEFALEFAQTPELNDGINPQEAKAMGSIYDLVKGLDIPSNLFGKDKLPSGAYKMVMEWTGNSNVKSDWSGWSMNMGPPRTGKVISAEPLGFEPGEDKINYKELEKGALDWVSYSGKKDLDALTFAFTFPQSGKVGLHVNKAILEIEKSKFLSKGQITFDENDGLEGTLIIKNADGNLAPEVYAIRDMVLSGESDFRFSAPLQALLWGYMDGKFKKGDNPLKNYQSALEFVKPIWGDMKGPRWSYEEAVLSGRVGSDFRLLNYHNTMKIKDEDYIGPWKSPKRVYESGFANCQDASKFSRDAVEAAGYRKTYLLWVDHPSDPRGHVILAVEKRENEVYVINKPGWRHLLEGPFNSINEIPHIIRQFL